MHYTVPYLESRQNPRSRALCTTPFRPEASLGWNGAGQNLDRSFVSSFSPLSLSVMIEPRVFDFGDPVT